MPAKKPKKNPLPKNPTLNDYLKRNMRPPTRGAGAPPDYDVITPGMGYTKPTKGKPPAKLVTPKQQAKPTPDRRNAGLTPKQIKEINLRKPSNIKYKKVKKK